MRILIVDDSKAMRMIVQRALRQAGYGDHTLKEASNGQEALEAIRKNKPDMVLSDWNMPVLNGIDLLKALRAEGNAVKFGFVTSEGTPEMRQLARESGAAFLIAKPFTADTFKLELSLLLQ
jgi:two-component system chemotaxis response regulator CheY